MYSTSQAHDSLEDQGTGPTLSGKTFQDGFGATAEEIEASGVLMPLPGTSTWERQNEGFSGRPSGKDGNQVC